MKNVPRLTAVQGPDAESRWSGCRLRNHRSLRGCTALLATLVCLFQGTAAARPNPLQNPSQSPQRQTGTGRVTATLTMLDSLTPLAGVDVELRALDGNIVIAKTLTDTIGEASFPDVAVGQYVIAVTVPGFVPTVSAPFEVSAAETAHVTLHVQLTYQAPKVEVHAALTTADIQPVAASDMLSASVLDIAPLEGDDFQSLLPLLPGVVRGPDGRLRAKGGQPTQGALQISSTSLVDPSSGDFDLELPGQSLESIELLANPFAAEYGRFSTSVTQIRTRRGTNEWEMSPGNLLPRFRKGFLGIRSFEPRFSVRGPLKKDRLFLAQDFQARYVRDPVKSLPGEPNIGLTSFDSFTRIDGVISTQHSLGGLIVMFPRTIDHLTMNTFRPPETTPEFNQGGVSIGVQDRYALSPRMVLESTLAGRWFEIDVNNDGREPMVYAPQTQSGSFFNDQERDVNSIQWVETLSLSIDNWHGQHLLKFGFDFQDSAYDGNSASRPVEVRRLDGSLAELQAAPGPTTQHVSASELALFAQDAWRVGSRVTFELGLRMDREDVIEKVNFSPRAGVAVSVLPEGRAILRGGLGRFRQRTPLNVGAFTAFEDRIVTRFGPDGEALGPPVTLVNVPDSDLETPQALAGNVEWNQRFGRRALFKANYLNRRGSREYILEPDLTRGELRLLSSGTSKYWELELTGRYVGGESRDVSVSYVRSHGTADLNNYDQFYGNLRNPIVRPNEHNLIPTDVPHRLLIRGTLGLPGKWEFAPVLEIRSGFPWSAVDESQDFVGPRNRAGRLPRVKTFDFSLSRRWHLFNRRFRAGIRMYNILGATAERDVQNNIASPDYGQFFNPLERSIGFVLNTR
jgi:outer membrane receptor protein involved in Fe transport